MLLRVCIAGSQKHDAKPLLNADKIPDQLTVKNAHKMTKSIRCFSRTVNCCFNILDVLTKSDC